MARADEVARDLVLGLITAGKLSTPESVTNAYRQIFTEVNVSHGVYTVRNLSPVDYRDGKFFKKD
ncbi:hypothetical protein [Lacticaseibacillus daqingensis]|uniref:hypothetical protein n=1 Tax=Lacticaseibacillus daqingensis TaxID=2486014 RepID=UPI000F7835BB|nr:hypothetical protein [Lacticaseibacillus daqingensis]